MGMELRIRSFPLSLTDQGEPIYHAPGDICWRCDELPHGQLRAWFGLEIDGKKAYLSRPACPACLEWQATWLEAH